MPMVLGMSRPPLTSIVILTLNELEYTRRCVDSIAAHTPERYEFVFVDNGSTDGTLEYLRAIPGAIVIANDRNVGFGGGCNQGISAARGERILLLNNDTVATPGWLGAMHRALDADERIGIVGPRSNHVAGEQLVEQVPYDQWTLDELDDFLATRSRAIEHGAGWHILRLIGFCLLLRREVVDQVGGFDVRFGLGNFEDDDFCLRAAVAGWRLWVADDAFVHHFGSRTFAGAGIRYDTSMESNWRKFQRKWHLQPAEEVTEGRQHGYLPLPVVQRTPFDRALHYAPLVAVPHDAAEVRFERRGTAVLVATDVACHQDLREAFSACCDAFATGDDVTVVVRVDPRDPAAYGVLEAVADERSALPDVVVVEASAYNDMSVIRACDRVLAHGQGAYGRAAFAAISGIESVTIDALRAAAGTLAA